jgi:hypothetical protein
VEDLDRLKDILFLDWILVCILRLMAWKEIWMIERMIWLVMGEASRNTLALRFAVGAQLDIRRAI